MKKDKTLLELCLEHRFTTDKYYESGKTHSYIDNLYEELFSPIRNTATNVLEIGICSGGSISLWSEYFPNATITGVDLFSCGQSFPNKKVVQIIANAYGKSVSNFLTDDCFDVIIDDGSHKLEDIKTFLSNYIPKLKKENGVLIVEDIQDVSWITQLQDFIPEHLHNKTYVEDLREKDNRYDSLVLFIKT